MGVYFDYTVFKSAFWRYYVTIKTPSDGAFDENGIWHENNSAFIFNSQVPCDIQPDGETEITTDSGKVETADYRLYTQTYIEAQFNTRSKVTYNGKDYDVIRVERYPDYCLSYIKAVS